MHVALWARRLYSEPFPVSAAKRRDHLGAKIALLWTQNRTLVTTGWTRGGDAGNKRTKELFLVSTLAGADKKAPDSVPGDDTGCGLTRPRRIHGFDVLDGVDELRVRVAK